MFKKIFPYGLALVAVCGVYDAFPIKLPLVVSWALTAIVIAAFVHARKFCPQKNMALINAYLLWNIFCIVRGCFVAEIYWDWKNLITTAFGMLLPAFCYAFAMPQYCALLFRNLIKWSIVVFPLVLLFSTFTDRAPRYLTFFYLFLICISALPKKWKMLTVAVLLFSCLYDVGARSTVIRAVVAALLGVLFYFKGGNIRWSLRLVQRFVPFVPIVLFVFGAVGTFNIFKMDEYMGEHIVETNVKGEENDVNLTADTRTLIYEENVNSAIKNKYVLLGRTPARGFDTNLMLVDFYDAMTYGVRLGERHGSEVSVLNVFLHAGLIGVILYFLVFYYGSYLAVFKSNNIYMKLIGTFVVFRWCYGWVEDFNQFDINYATLWMFIAMCYSVQFRSMNDAQFKQWILNIVKR